jgi:hypothetical protein
MRAPRARTSHARLKLPRKRWVALVAAVATLAIAVPVAFATFTDVPPSNPFYADINAVQGAGITSGCGGGNFCPTDNITRQAEAAFVHRAAARVGYGTITAGNVAVASSTPADIAVTTIDVGGVPGGTQVIKLDASLGAYAAGADIPEDLGYFISQDGVGQITVESGITLATAGPSGLAIGNGSFTAAVTVPTASTQTFRLQAVRFAGAGTSSAWGSLTGSTAPFGSTGASTLAPSGRVRGAGGLSSGR